MSWHADSLLFVGAGWRKAHRLGIHIHKERNYFCPAALNRIVFPRHGRKRAHGDADYDAVGALQPRGAHDFVAFDRAVIPLGTPIGEEVTFAIASARLPELVRLLRISRDQRVKEMAHGALFRIVAEEEPARDDHRESDEHR